MNIWRKCLFVKKTKKTNKITYKIAPCDRVENLKEPERFKKGSDSGSTSILAAIGLVVFMVVSIAYATYLFIDATHISDAAGIHVTGNLMLAINDVQGKLYNNPEKGIQNWMIHDDKKNGFEIVHPNNWEMQNGTNDEYLILKAYKALNVNTKSMIMSVEVGGSDEADSEKVLKDMASEENFVWSSNWKEEEINGRMGIRTGKTKTTDGLLRDAIFWAPTQNKKALYLEATYYTDNFNDAKYNEGVFENVISEFKIL